MIRIIEKPIGFEEFQKIAEEAFPGVVKGVVDVEKRVIAVGAEMHADEEQALLESGSIQENLWGVNFHVEKQNNDWIEFDSMINVRPRQGNRSRSVEDVTMQKKILVIVDSLVFRS